MQQLNAILYLTWFHLMCEADIAVHNFCHEIAN
jgi:hypothetical protein